MINLVDLEKEQAITSLWRQAFRPFFLFGAGFAIVALGLWLLTLKGLIKISPYGGALFWHSHEMIFGFTGAIIVGFLLTAVQNWTGYRAIHGRPLIGLFCIWALARILLLANSEDIQLFTAIVDLSFFPLAAIFMGALIVKAGNWRNLFFVPILLLLFIANLLSHLALFNLWPDHFEQGLYAAVFLISCLMVIIGGRVIPMFTANGTGTPKVEPLPWLEKSAIGISAIIALLLFTNGISGLPGFIKAAIFYVAALAHAIRQFRWRPQITTKTPLVWSLHLGYAFIPLGYAMTGGYYSGLDIDLSTAIHALTAGAMGTMILAMIARVSLGHSGRPLVVKKIMPYAFICIVAGALLRILAPYLPGSIAALYLIAGGFWIMAYLAYLCCYTGILLTPRADGRPG